jgi:hypothetical protein
MIDALRRRVTDLLIRSAVRRTRRRYPEWADAMLNESANLRAEGERLKWAVGCFTASFRLPDTGASTLYPIGLLLGIGSMILYQWSADENLCTLLLLALNGLALGVLRPQRFLVSGLVVGSVVASVNIFEALTDIRPAYETVSHSVVHSLRWTTLVVPALLSAAVGRFLALRFRSEP